MVSDAIEEHMPFRVVVYSIRVNTVAWKQLDMFVACLMADIVAHDCSLELAGFGFAKVLHNACCLLVSVPPAFVEAGSIVGLENSGRELIDGPLYDNLSQIFRLPFPS